MTLAAIPPAIRVTYATSTNSSPSNVVRLRRLRGERERSPAAARSIALSAFQGRAECPERPWNVQVALTLPRQPACSSLAVGSIITTSSAVERLARQQRRERALCTGSSSRPKNRQRSGAPASASSIITASAPFMSLAPRPCTRPSRDPAGAVALRGDGVEVAGEQQRRRPPGRPARRCRRGRAPRRRRRRAGRPRAPRARASSRDSDGMSISSSVRAASRAPRSGTGGTIASPGVRYCGVDVSAKPGNQQLATLHERRAPEGGVELVATFYAPGTVEQVARTIEGFGRGEAVVAVDAPSGPRRDLLGAGAPLRAALGLPDGRYERMRVCDAMLFRRGLPLYPVPGRRPDAAGLGAVDRRRVRAVRGARRARAVPAGRRAGADRAGRDRRAALRPAVRDLPRRGLLRACWATARRPSGRRGACSSGSPRCA